MRKLTNFLLILLLAGAVQALLRHSLREQRNKAAIERIFRHPPRPGGRVGQRVESDKPPTGARARWAANERRRR